jgi:putative ABC transport system permease protein
MAGIIASNLLRRPGRSLLTAAGVGVGVAVIVALLGLTQGLRQTAAGLVHLGGGDLGVFQANVSDPTASVLPAAIVGQLARRPYVARATPLVLVVEGVGADPGAIVFGADPGGFFARRLVYATGTALRAGQVAVGDRLAAELHLRAGHTLMVKGHRLAIAGVYHSGIVFEDMGAVTDIATAQTINGQHDEQTDVVVQLAPGAREAGARAQITHDFPGTQVIADAQDAARLGANNVLISNAITAIVVVALIVGAIVVTNTISLAVLERQAEFGLLSTVGWGPWRLGALVLGEGVAVSVVGAAFGLLLGVVGSDLLVHALGVRAYVSPSITAWGLGRGLLVGVLIGVFGGLYPTWRVTRMRPVRALARA